VERLVNLGQLASGLRSGVVAALALASGVGDRRRTPPVTESPRLRRLIRRVVLEKVAPAGDAGGTRRRHPAGAC
jgi:hypothetical protein